ncbi:hypothetical protein JG687_00011080 [Phytophthora cactorum]|uniref:Uncharacterized protein n=1 Tax=Phytophthora cactorum TaxID=29920 RepID=A0A8T1U9D9_9STRA|nr:hypothetical protein JG687_00011080 [Phytophthora cactorum]
MTRDNKSKQDQINAMENLLQREAEKHQEMLRLLEDEHATQKQQAGHEIDVLRRQVCQLELHVEAYDVLEAANGKLRDRVELLMQEMEQENKTHAEEIHKVRLDMFNHKMALEKTFRKALQELDADYLKKAFNAMSEESKNALVANAKLKDELQLQSIGVDNLMHRFTQQAKHFQRMCVTKLDQVVAANSAAKRKPKPGDWVEVSSKQFVKIQFLSADGLFVVGAFPADTSRSITIALEQMYRVSSSVWRANYLTKHQALALSASSANNTRIGKLHRDSEAFHRHGAARNQGFPNHFVTAQMLEDMHRERNSSISSSSQTKTIEIFSTNDTLDANYVLTSPEHISAQNYCAVTSSLQQRRQPGGLWSPVRQCAPYSVLSSQAPSLTQSSSLNDLKMRKPRIQQQAANALQSPQSDDWLEIRRAMQAQLGIVVPSEGNDCRPLTSSSDSDLQTRTGVSSFLTTLPDSDASDSALATDPLQIDRPRLTTPPLTSSSSQKLVIGGGTKLESARVWHQVATKTEFVVAAPALGASHSAPLLPRQIRQATSQAKFPKQPFATMATMSMMVNSDSMLLESIPRLRWSPKNNRFHFNMPVAAEPGENGFVLLQEFEHADSLSSMKLPPKERHHLEEMERINHLIHDVENSVHLHETVKVLEQKRMHHDEYHERAVNDEEERPQGLKKKDSFRQRQPPKRSYEGRRQKPTRTGRVHQPK